MKKILKVALKNTLMIYIFTVLFDAITYTFCFTYTGILRSDIFNKLQGENTIVNLGIVSLVVLSTLMPLIVNVTKQISGYLFSSAQQNINNNLKRYIYSKLYQIPLNKNVNELSGEIIITFRDDVADVVAFFSEIYNQFPKLLMSIVNIIVLIKINSIFSAIIIAPLLIVIFTIHFIQDRLVKNKRLAREATDKATQFLGDIFNSLEAIKLSKNTEKYLGHYEELCAVRRKYSIKDTFLQKLLSIFSLNLMFLALAIILFFTYDAIQTGVFTIGNFILFEYYFWFLTDLPNAFSSVFSRYKQMSVAKQRIQALDESNIINDENISYKIIEGMLIQNNYQVNRNELCVIKGYNGSGKSTLLKNIFSNNPEHIGWINEKGEIQKNIITPPQICFLSQTTHLISGTLKNNICMSLKYEENKMLDILKFVNLDKEFEQEKLSLNTYVGDRGEQLSGGQMKRLALARLLYREPEVMLLDDVTSGLDIVTEKKIIENFRSLKDKIIIIASNSKQLDGNEDQIISMGENYAR